MAYRLSGFPRLLQHTDVSAAAATQRFPPPPSSGGALAMNSQGINRGRACRVMSTPSPRQCKLPDIFMSSGPDPGSSVQPRSVTPRERHLYAESGLFHEVVRELGRRSEHHEVTGAGSSRWGLQARACPCPKGAPDHKLESGKEHSEHEPCSRVLSELCL